MSTDSRGRARQSLAVPLLLALPVMAGGSAPQAGNSGPPRRHVVEIRGMAFRPRVLEAAQGDTIVWINRDIVPHTATADGGKMWDTGIITQGDSGGSYVPRRSGETAYICRLHPTMQGRLIVTGRPRPH